MYSSPSPKYGAYVTMTENDSSKEKNLVQYSIESLEAKGENLSLEGFRSKVDHELSLLLNIRKSRDAASCKELFIQNVHKSIPKHITTFEEKYVLRCLEQIRNYSLRAAAIDFTSNVDAFPMDLGNLVDTRHTGVSNMVSLAIDYPLGSVSECKSMINILNSPLLKQFGSRDGDDNLRSKNVREVDNSRSVDSPQVLCGTSSNKEGVLLNQKYASQPVHRRLFSVTSTYSSVSDMSSSASSSSSSSASSFQGMLQCMWKDGMPHHVFTVDDKKDIYVASVSNNVYSDSKDLDYVYSFHLRKNGKKEFDTHELELETVGKMHVSSITVHSDDTSREVRETRFVLSVSSENRQISANTLRKTKKLTRKVADVFRSHHYMKERPPSKFRREISKTSLEDALCEPSLQVSSGLDDDDDTNAESSKDIPNLELAAIIVKESYKNLKVADVGGWGLKFLKSSPDVATNGTCNSEEDSKSLNVVIPAGYHGGPRTSVGGPSRLMERWNSGGHCDCGGWDIGCPLTILNTTSGHHDSSPPTDNSAECKSIDLFMQGSKQEVPALKMVNIHDDLYFIHFQSSLSPLQSFAIAAAIFHSHNPVIGSKMHTRPK